MCNEILLVEDEAMLQVFWEDVCALSEIVIGAIAETTADALRLLDEQEFCGVVLDVNLVGETSEAVADKLRTMDLPVIVSTGHDLDSIPEAYNGFRVIQKPFRVQDMQNALVIMKTTC